MKTATVTFHAAHNYGAVLQAFAFQQCLKDLGVDNEIINIRTERNRSFYPVPSLRKYPVYVRLLHISDYLGLKCKYQLFEEFLTRNLITTAKEYRTVEELESEEWLYDYMFAAGDQIWNTKLFDFTPAFFLPFAVCPKIAYSVSMGPSPEDAIKPEYTDIFKKCINEFREVSIREPRSSQFLATEFYIDSEVLSDTAFLLSADQYRSKLELDSISPAKGRYVLIYSPSRNIESVRVGSDIARRLGIGAVITTPLKLNERISFRNVKVKLKTGPREFLRLIMDADLVLCSSLHAVVFSILFHKDFYVLNRTDDSRMQAILDKFSLAGRMITSDNYKEKIYETAIDFSKVDSTIASERQKGLSFLKKALCL